MTFDWKEYQPIAEFLANTDQHALPPEAAQRAAISRAYYACFGLICEYVTQHRKFECPEKDVHSALIQHFVKRNKKNIADGLKELRKWRNMADYNCDEIENIEDVCLNALNASKNLVKQRL